MVSLNVHDCLVGDQIIHEYTVCFYSTKSKVHTCGDDTGSITNTSSLSELPLETATSRNLSIKLMKSTKNSSMPRNESNLRRKRKRNGSFLLINALSHVVEVVIIHLNFFTQEESPVPKEIGYVINSIEISRVLRFYFFYLLTKANREGPENGAELHAPCNFAFRNIG